MQLSRTAATWRTRSPGPRSRQWGCPPGWCEHGFRHTGGIWVRSSGTGGGCTGPKQDGGAVTNQHGSGTMRERAGVSARTGGPQVPSNEVDEVHVPEELESRSAASAVPASGRGRQHPAHLRPHPLPAQPWPTMHPASLARPCSLHHHKLGSTTQRLSLMAGIERDGEAGDDMYPRYIPAARRPPAWPATRLHITVDAQQQIRPSGVGVEEAAAGPPTWTFNSPQDQSWFCSMEKQILQSPSASSSAG